MTLLANRAPSEEIKYLRTEMNTTRSQLAAIERQISAHVKRGECQIAVELEDTQIRLSNRLSHLESMIVKAAALLRVKR